MYLHRLILPTLLASGAASHAISLPSRPRTVVTTDMESDDLASFVRYMLYTNDLDTQGLVYTASKYHWEGDGRGTKFFLPNREYNTSQTQWRPTGTTTIERHLLKAYVDVYSNLRVHDKRYPTPEYLRSITKVGNVQLDGEMAEDTPGSNLIRGLILDSDPRTLYLQAWGGTNTIARALASIAASHSNSSSWNEMKARIERKVVILASGFQDNTYAEYIAPQWPNLRVEELSKGYDTWGFNCNDGAGNVRGLPDNNKFYQGEWIKENIQIGPLGSLYRSWLDGQTTFGGGDPLDVFGDPAKAAGGWCKPMQKYDFLSEGDNVAFNPLLPTGLEAPGESKLGGWGGRRMQNSSVPNLWVLVDKEVGRDGSEVESWTTGRWVDAAQNDFAARIQWTSMPMYQQGNHAPRVVVEGQQIIRTRAGSNISLSVHVSDPDGDHVAVKWWQYLEEGTYPSFVDIEERNDTALVRMPTDAQTGQTVSIIVQGTDDGAFPLTRYDRILIEVV